LDAGWIGEIDARSFPYIEFLEAVEEVSAPDGSAINPVTGKTVYIHIRGKD
jgi:hypothetical protein